MYSKRQNENSYGFPEGGNGVNTNFYSDFLSSSSISPTSTLSSTPSSPQTEVVSPMQPAASVLWTQAEAGATYLGSQNNNSYNTSCIIMENELFSMTLQELQDRRRQILQQQQIIMQQQQQLAAVTQPNSALSLGAANGNDVESNEISKSLKMFALYGPNGNKNEPAAQKQAYRDAVMQDFARNGQDICDEMNSFQAQQARAQANAVAASIFRLSSNLQNYNNYDAGYLLNGGALANANIPNQFQIYQNLNLHFNQLRNAQMAHLQNLNTNAAVTSATAAATAAQGAQPDADQQRNKRQYHKRPNIKLEKVAPGQKRCVFCENNKEPEAVVRSHNVRDIENRVLCPRLRIYTCPICHASGDHAHTIKYCPKKPIVTMQDAVKAESMRLAKQGYKPQMKV